MNAVIYIIVGGVPAKPIRRRFDDATIGKLAALSFSRAILQLWRNQNEAYCH